MTSVGGWGGERAHCPPTKEEDMSDKDHAKTEFTAEELQEMQANLDKMRATACMQEIKESLEKHGCALHYQEIRLDGEVVKSDWVVTTMLKTPQG
jgi:ribosomal protein L31E